MVIHQEGARLLGQRHMAVFRGEGGEIERRPTKRCEVRSLIDGVAVSEDWPALLPDSRQPHDEEMKIERLVTVWRGKAEDAYAAAAVTGTLAITLRTLGRAKDMDAAKALAESLWRDRDRTRLGMAA
jgi:anthranilate phosphoribosyltransferase